MQTRLDNSSLVLLLPKKYTRVRNGGELYGKMYHERKGNDIQMFQSLSNRSYGNIVISHIDPSDAMPFGGKEAVINEIHGNLTDTQGLIEVEQGTNPRGYEYLYSIIKTYHPDVFSANYCLRMDIRNGREIIEVNASFFEQFMTGERDALAASLTKRAGIEDDPETGFPKNWFQDPYDPGYDKGHLMNMSERRGFDGLFPEHPLSQARELVLALTEDSYYKTKDELSAGSKKEKDKTGDEDERKTVAYLFSKDAKRAGAYKVDVDAIESPFKFLAKSAGGAIKKKASGLNKVKVPFNVPDDFKSKLNQPLPNEFPGWGKREYIGFGKTTPIMDAAMISFQVTQAETMCLTDTDKLIASFKEVMDDNQCLINAKCGLTRKGNRYALAIRKIILADAEDNNRYQIEYMLNFNIRINGKIYFINGSVIDSPEFGSIRVNALKSMKRGSSELQLNAEEWQKDPYDPDRKEGLLMDWTEDADYDFLFPYSALTELRQFVMYIISNN